MELNTNSRNYGIDSKVLDYLMQKRKPQVEPMPSNDNQLMASLADASAQLGTLGGVKADTTPVQRFADVQDKRNLQMQQQRMSAQNQEENRKLAIANLLDKYNMQNMAAKARAEEKKADREFEKEMYSARRDRSLQDQKELAQYKTNLRQQEKIAETKQKTAPKPFEEKLANLSTTEKDRFDKVAMGLKAVVDMNDALQSGDWTVSARGNNYTEARARFKEAIGRLQSGGAINKEEAQSFLALAPNWKDTTELQRNKMIQLLTLMSQRVQTMGFDPEDVLQNMKDIETRMSQRYMKQKQEPGTAMADDDGYKIGEQREAQGSTWEYVGNGIWTEVE